MKRALVAFACVTLVGTPAFAQKPAPKAPAKAALAPSPPPPSPPELADALSGEAKADYEAGKLLYDDGDFGGALVKFHSAHGKSKDPRLLWNIAACEKSLRHYANVLAYVRQYLDEGSALLSSDDKREAAELLTAIEPFTASLELAVNEANATVFIDDKPVGATPLAKPVVVDIGMRKLRIAKDGFEEVTREVPVGGSPKIHLDVKLEKVLHEGTLVVSARPGDEIFIDGTRMGMGTWRGVLPSGGHMLRVTAPEMRAYQTDLVLHDKEMRTVAITLDREVKPSGPVPGWVWIGGSALLVAGAAIGGYFLFRPEDRQPTQPIGTLDPGNVQASFPGVRFR